MEVVAATNASCLELLQGMIAILLRKRLAQLHDRVWKNCSRMLPTGKHAMSESTKQ